MVPEGSEDFVDVESVLELGVELVGGSSDSNVAIEANQAISEVPVGKLICAECLIHDAGFIFLQEVENQLDKVARHIGVGRNLLLTEQQARQIEQVVNVILADQPQVVLLKLEIAQVVLVDVFQQVFRQERRDLVHLVTFNFPVPQ